MRDPLPISEAAESLRLSATRVRAMAMDGQLAAVKLGDRWFVERAAVEQRRRSGSQAGRRFSPRNAWALLSLASGERVEEIDPSVRSRLRRALSRDGLERLVPRLAHRAQVRSFSVHPGEVSHLLQDPEFVRSGISAAGDWGFRLVAGQEADGYLQATESNAFAARHALQPAGIEGNVRLRLVPGEAWRFLEGREVAPMAAVAVDLAEEPDPRSARLGRNALRELERHWRDHQGTGRAGRT